MNRFFKFILVLLIIGSFTNKYSFANAIDEQPIEMSQQNTQFTEAKVITNNSNFEKSPIDKSKLSIKERFILKKAEKKVVKDTEKGNGNPKSQLIALLLCFFLGGMGIHRFYLGYPGIGVIQLLTLGGCGIWSLIDFIMIITGDLKPADGTDYDPKF